MSLFPPPSGPASRTNGGLRPEGEASALRDLFRAWLASGRLELPHLPETVFQVLEASRDETSGVQELADLVHDDPSLSAHVLRAANSAAYGGSEPIESIHQAIARLGLKTVAHIATLVVVRGRVFRFGRHEAEIRALWPLSVSSAGWARAIASLRGADVEAAFLCGLLHESGRAVLLQALTDLEQELRWTFEDAEAAAVADSLHPEVGAAVVRQSKLPEWMIEAIAWHHAPDAAPRFRAEARLLALAEALAVRSLEHQPPPTVAQLLELPGARGLEFLDSEFEELLAYDPQVRTLVRAAA